MHLLAACGVRSGVGVGSASNGRDDVMHVCNSAGRRQLGRVVTRGFRNLSRGVVVWVVRLGWESVSADGVMLVGVPPWALHHGLQVRHHLMVSVIAHIPEHISRHELGDRVLAAQ